MHRLNNNNSMRIGSHEEPQLVFSLIYLNGSLEASLYSLK